MANDHKNTYSGIKIRSAAVGLFFLFSLSLSLLMGCDRPTEKPPFNIIDTGFWVSPTSNEETWWLDNNKILFSSSKDLISVLPPYKIKIWSLSTGQMVSSNLDSVTCVREGQVFYGVKNGSANKMATFFRGPLENAREHPNPDGSDSIRPEDHSMRLDSTFDCDWVPYDETRTIPYRRKLRGKNYVDVLEPRTQSSKGKAIYHAGPDDPGREVPFYGFTYSEFLDAYIVSHGLNDPAKPGGRSFWILERNGDLKELPYPPTLLHGRVTMYPVKQGYLVAYHTDPIPGADPFNMALYLLRGEKVERLIVGSVHGISISPDGCKVAFVHARNTEEYISRTKPYRTLKVIDFCSGGDKQ